MAHTEKARAPASPVEPQNPAVLRLRVVTYNVHRCLGLDRRCRPARIAAVLRELKPDIVALQEVWSVEGALRPQDQARFLAEELGLDLRLGMNRPHRGGDYGNAILSRFPMGEATNYDISVAGRERRGCLRADVVAAGTRLHVFNVHLGTARSERRRQGLRLIEAGVVNNRELLGPRLVLGDFNDWNGALTGLLLGAGLNSVDIRTHLRRSRTYPGLFPLVHLDHIYFDDGLELERLILHRTRETLVASDHLPLVADFRLLAAPVAATADRQAM